MKRNWVIAVVGTLVPVFMAFFFGYWTWLNYSDFIDLNVLVSDWRPFNLMIVTLFISGFFVGMVFVVIPMLYSVQQSAKRKQERQRLREEIKRELEIESHKEGTG